MTTSMGEQILAFGLFKKSVHRKPRTFDWPKDKDGQPLRVTEIYGSNTFNSQTMKEKLSKKVNARLQEIIKRGGKLDKSMADEIAQAVKEWATGKGATHFCHWFQPQTFITAEKHDAFLALTMKASRSNGSAARS